MNKLTNLVLGIAFFIFATFTGTSAFAAPPKDCVGVTSPIYSNQPGYSKKLDSDADGVICERGSLTIPVNGGNLPADSVPGQTEIRDANGNVISSTGQVDANGKPVKLDSNGNPIKTDEHGNPIKADNLANTGWQGVVLWLSIGVLAFGSALIVWARRVKKA